MTFPESKIIEKFSQTHIKVHNSNNPFVSPKIGDLVNINFSRGAKTGIIVNEFDSMSDRGLVFEVLCFETTDFEVMETTSMPFENEVTVIWQRKDNFCDSMEAESIAQQKIMRELIAQTEFDF